MNVLKLIEETKILQVRPQSYSKYVGISVVVVNERIFARAGRIGKSSWYSAFLKEKYGEIKINNVVFSVIALIPYDKKIIFEINNAYRKKYANKLEIINSIGNKPSPIFPVLEFVLWFLNLFIS